MEQSEFLQGPDNTKKFIHEYALVRYLEKNELFRMVLAEKNNKWYRIRIIPLSSLSDKNTGPFMNKCVKQEIEMAKNLVHPNIVSTVESFSEGDHYFIVYRHYPDSSLLDFLHIKGSLNEVKAKILLLQLVEAVKHASSAGFLKSPIGLTEVFFDGTGFRLGGFADQLYTQYADSQGHGQAQPQPLANNKLSEQHSIFCVAVIVYTAIYLHDPWFKFRIYNGKMNPTDPKDRINPTAATYGPNIKFPATAKLSNSFVEILTKMMDWDNNSRPGVEEILKKLESQDGPAPPKPVEDSADPLVKRERLIPASQPKSPVPPVQIRKTSLEEAKKIVKTAFASCLCIQEEIETTRKVAGNQTFEKAKGVLLILAANMSLKLAQSCTYFIEQLIPSSNSTMIGDCPEFYQNGFAKQYSREFSALLNFCKYIIDINMNSMTAYLPDKYYRKEFQLQKIGEMDFSLVDSQLPMAIFYITVFIQNFTGTEHDIQKLKTLTCRLHAVNIFVPTKVDLRFDGLPDYDETARYYRHWKDQISEQK